MNTSFDNDDDDDDDFDQVKDSDEDGFSDAYEEFIGSDPQDPTDLPFYPYEEIIEPFPKKIKTKPYPITEEENHRSTSLAKRSPTRNKCLLFLVLFIFFLILTPFIVFIILS
jgi:hypothetical protein